MPLIATAAALAALLLGATHPARADAPAPPAAPARPALEPRAYIAFDWVGLAEDEELRCAFADTSEGAVDPFAGGSEIRRARLGVHGSLSPFLYLKCEYDFGGGDAEAKDVYLELRGVPQVPTIRFGHQHEPLNRLSGSSKYTLFLERALPGALASGRNTGIRLLASPFQRRVTFSAGGYRDSDGRGAGNEGEGYDLAARATGLVRYRDDGRRLIHLGVFYGRQEREAAGVRFRQRAETHYGPYLVDTGVLAADRVDLLGGEWAVVQGPLSLQAEYLRANVDLKGQDASALNGYFVAATWSPTGGHRRYSRSSGAFSGFQPRHSFQPQAGYWGGWVLLARYSHLDLDDGVVAGGRLSDWTLGINWYLESNVRVMWNYVLAERDEGGRVQVAQMRIQVQT